MSYEDDGDFSLDGLGQIEEQQAPRLSRVPAATDGNPFEESQVPQHKVKTSRAKRTVHTSGRLLKNKAKPSNKAKAAAPAPPPKVKEEAKDEQVVKRVSFSSAPDDERRKQSMDVAKRIIEQAINHAVYVISEEFVRAYGKSMRTMKKDMIEAIQSGAKMASETAIDAIKLSTTTSKHQTK